MSTEIGGTLAMSGLITSRRLSVLIVLIYLTIFLFAAQGHPSGEVLGRLIPLIAYFILPLACIWFGDEMGDYVGMLPGPAISSTSPGLMVKVGGWFLLLLPAIIGVIVFANT